MNESDTANSPSGAQVVRRGRGRPTNTEESVAAKGQLIDTAARLFAEQGYEGTSLRQVADGANVTPAMVSYYFKDKSGLLEAVVREGLATMLGVVEQVASSQHDGEFTPHLIRSYLRTISASPWIPQVLIREVISKDTPLRDLFIEEFGKRAVELIPARLAEEIQGGRLRNDLDPRFTILSLVGMVLFPFIAYPVLGPLLNYDLDASFGERYADHAQGLFLRGAGVST